MFIKDFFSEEGYASSTRFVKILIVTIFCADWIWTRVYEKQPKFEPNIEVLGLVGLILGISLAQKFLEIKTPR